MAYRKIDPRIWDDEVFDALSLDEAFAALWLITSKATNRAGVAFFSLVEAAEKLRADSPDTVWDTLSTVCSKLGWLSERLGRNKAVMILRTHFKYNPPMNRKHLEGQLSDLADLPRCTLIEEEYSKTVREHLDTRWQADFDAILDTVSHTVSHTLPARAQERVRSHLKRSVAKRSGAEADEEPLSPRRGRGASSLRSQGQNPRARGTNPRAIAEKAKMAESKQRSRLLARILKHVDETIDDGSEVQSVGLYEKERGIVTWDRLSTERLEEVAGELRKRKSR